MPNSTSSIPTFGVVLGVIFCTAFFKSSQFIVSISISLLVGVVLFVFIYLNKRVCQIQINKQKKLLKITVQTWVKKKIVQFPISETSVSYKNEIGAKGTIRKSLKIYYENKVRFEVIPGLSGWSDKTLNIIVKEIQSIKAI